MKTLYLLRHAKSSWENPDLSDFDRPLNDRGEKDAPRMGKRLKERGIVPDAIYASPATRALTTARVVAEILKFPSDNILTDRKLYHASSEQLLALLRMINDNHNFLMMAGHNPGLTEFANGLLRESVANIPTTGVVGAQLNINSWKDARWGCGEILFFDFPKKKQ